MQSVLILVSHYVAYVYDSPFRAGNVDVGTKFPKYKEKNCETPRMSIHSPCPLIVQHVSSVKMELRSNLQKKDARCTVLLPCPPHTHKQVIDDKNRKRFRIENLQKMAVATTASDGNPQSLRVTLLPSFSKTEGSVSRHEKTRVSTVSEVSSLSERLGFKMVGSS